jgi:hypothetical protein
MDSVSAPETLVIRESLGRKARVSDIRAPPFLGPVVYELGPEVERPVRRSTELRISACCRSERASEMETRVCLPPQIPRGTLGPSTPPHHHHHLSEDDGPANLSERKMRSELDWWRGALFGGR